MANTYPQRLTMALALSITWALCSSSPKTAHGFTQPGVSSAFSSIQQNRQRPSMPGGQRWNTRNRRRLHVSFSTDEATAATTIVDLEVPPETTTTPGAEEETQNDQVITPAVSEKSEFHFLASLVSKKIGKVEEHRLVFPELSTGEVPRMFSSLKYTKSSNGKVVSALHAAGSTMGAAALVAGTTVGAGVLALPTATAAAGFLPSTAAMGLAWWYMTMSGLLIAELSINRMGETGRTGLGLLGLFDSYLGKPWGLVGSAAYFFLHYAVMVACIAQGGANLDGFLNTVGLDSLTSIPGIGQILFAGSCGVALYAAKPCQVEKANNLLLAGVAATFLGIMAIGAGTADFSALVDPVNQHPELVVNAFPILFLSMVYQNIVPTVVTQLEGNRSKITNAIIAGTTLPFLMFVAWNAVVLGNVMGELNMDSMNPVALLQSGAGGPMLSALVGGFSELLLITSLIGFVGGLLDAFTDASGLPSVGPSFEKWKPALFAAVLLPPLALSVDNPDIFFHALDYGGAFGVSTLFLVLPPFMVWKERYGEEQKPIITKPMVPFGKIPLTGMGKAAGVLIVEQGAEKLGIIDFIHEHLL